MTRGIKRAKGRGSTQSAPPTGGAVSSKTALLDYARGRVAKERLVRQRLLRTREGQVEDVTATLPQEVHGLAYIHAAGVLYRTIEPREFVGVLLPIEVPDPRPGMGSRNVKASLFEANSPAGGRLRKMWLPGAPGRAQELSDLVLDSALRLDFHDPAFPVDLVIENHLARVAFVGAVHREGGDWQSNPNAQALEEWSERAAILLVRPVGHLEWESVRDHLESLSQVTLPALQPRPISATRAVVGLGPAPRKGTPISELLDSGPYEENRQIGFVRLFRGGGDTIETARALVCHPSVTPRIRLWLLATAIDCSLRQGDLDTAGRLIPPLVRFADAQVEAAGGVRAWVDAQWPDPLPAGGDVATVAISGLASAYGWWAGTRFDPAELLEAIARLETLRDALLDRAGAPAGSPGERVQRLARVILRGAEGPERRCGRFADVIMSRQLESAAGNLLGTAAFQAAMLHSQAAILATVHGRVVDQEGQLRLPNEQDPTGLFDEAQTVFARMAVLVASECAPTEPQFAVTLLDYAADRAPFEPHVLTAANEGRFRLGVVSSRFLSDLADEPGLAAAAEALSVAEKSGVPRKRYADALGKIVSPDPTLAWAARIRLMGFQPQAMSALSRIQSLLSAAPTEIPEALSDRLATQRAGFALFGDNPRQTLAEWRARLEAQVGALEEATALRSEALLELWTRPAPPRKERPSVPLTSKPGAVEDALAALRWRLSRPAATGLECHKALYAHARDCLELQAAEVGNTLDAGDWLVALGADDIGLVPALDRFLRAGDEGPVQAALEIAIDAMTHVLHLSWRVRMANAVRQVEASVARSGSADLIALMNAARVAVGAAATTSERDSAEALLGQVYDALAELRQERAAVEDSSEDPGEDEDAFSDGFLPMFLHSDALERSRHELKTPTWAVQIGIRQIALYNEARGRRDLKMLQGTRGVDGALWELRHRDARHPVRTTYRHTSVGPMVVAVMVKDDEDDQRRVLARIATWGAQ